MQPDTDFFISYSSKDKTFAALVAEILQNEGYITFHQEEDFGSVDFTHSMDKALKSEARVICLYSDSYLRSDYCRKEAFTALAGDLFNKKERVIPFRIGECAPDGLLQNIPYLDLVPMRDQDQSALRDIILATVKPGAVLQMTGPMAELWIEPKTLLHANIAHVPNFTAREKDLEALKTHLFAGEMTAVTQTAVAGHGGIGKSVLAREYGWLNREDYQGVWWILADTPTNISSSLFDLGKRLVPGLEAVEDRQEAVDMTLDAIANSGYDKPWLLIYDNIIDPSALEGVTPRDGAHILITSRWNDWHGHASRIDLGLFTEEEAITFILDRTSREDRDGAKQLAETLGYLPLALEQAAAFCLSSSMAFADYINHYQELLKQPPRHQGGYPLSVWATFTLALDAIIQGDEAKGKPPCPEAEKLLGPVAYLASEDIPLDLFDEEFMSSVEKHKAIAALSDVSLISIAPLEDGTPGLNLHRLVQEIIRERVEQDKEVLVARTMKRFIAVWPDSNEIDDPKVWPHCETYLPQCLSLFAYVPEEGEGAVNSATLYNMVGYFLNMHANYAQAEPLYQRALVIDEKSYGPDHPHVALSLNNLASLYDDTNRRDEAEPLYIRALAIREKSLGSNHPDTANSLNNLALLYDETNRKEDAEPLYLRALEIRKKSYGPEHPQVALSLNNLAALYKDTNRLDQAEPLYKRALAIRETSYGPEHPDVALSLNNLATLYYSTNRKEQAEPLLIRALAIRETSLGPEHPHTASSLNNLAMLYQNTNRMDQAEPLLIRALATYEKSLGPEHPSTITVRNNLEILQNRDTE